MKIAVQYFKNSTGRWPMWSCLPHIVLLIAGFALLPKAQAVSPPPDGGYPGENTAEGTSALLHLSGGTNNTAVGWASLGFDVTGNLNTAVGAGTLLFTTADRNTAAGAGALLSNTTGEDNTANGAFALFSNTTGAQNTAVGSAALLNGAAGIENTAIGYGALHSDVGSSNTAVGANALGSNAGTANTAIGDAAGFLITGNANICIGDNVYGFAGENNTVRIGTNLPTGAGDSACYIGGIYNQAGDPSTTTLVGIDANGKLATIASSRRVKRDIKAMDKVSEAILALKPVIFHYKSDVKNTPQFGLIAEEVGQVNPDLVVRDDKGEILTVRYEQINAMLLNEFLKEHRKVEEQQASIGELRTTVAKQEARIAQQQKMFESRFAEQEKRIAFLASNLQKVSTQVEMGTFATERIDHGGPAAQIIATDP